MPKYSSELPPTRAGRYERGPFPSHVPIVKMLKKRPGEWVKVKSFANVSAANKLATGIRRGTYIAFRDGDYEAVVRGSDVYARFNG